MTDVTSTDILCNAGGLDSGADTEVATVQAGSTVSCPFSSSCHSASWLKRSVVCLQVGFALDQGIIHPGPVLVYMSAAGDDVTTYDGSGPWFKISELGAEITEDAIEWPADDITKYTFEIPDSTRKSFDFPIVSVSSVWAHMLIDEMHPQHLDSICCESSTSGCTVLAKRVARNSTHLVRRSTLRVPVEEVLSRQSSSLRDTPRMTLASCSIFIGQL